MELSGFDNGAPTQYSPFNISPMDVDGNNDGNDGNDADAGDTISGKRLTSDQNLAPLAMVIKKLRIDIHDFSTKDWDEINEDIKKKGNHRTKEQEQEHDKQHDHTSIINSIDNVRIKITKVHREYLSTERRLVNAFNQNKEFNNKVSDFSDFLEGYNEKEYNIEELNTQLLDLINKNNDDNNLRTLISDFVEKRNEFTKLLRVTRVIQELQTTPCCPMCLTAPLDSFVNPCGHTGCKDCLIRSIQNNNSNMNLNCPICRKSISCINPLYMI